MFSSFKHARARLNINRILTSPDYLLMVKPFTCLALWMFKTGKGIILALQLLIFHTLLRRWIMQVSPVSSLDRFSTAVVVILGKEPC